MADDLTDAEMFFSDGVQATIKAFEADPDFTLRSRIEALAEEWKYYCKFDEDGNFEEAGFFARRLRDILKEPKG